MQKLASHTDRAGRTALQEVMNRVDLSVPTHPAVPRHLSLMPPVVPQDRMIITDQQDQMEAPTDLVMPVELNDEQRVDRTVLMVRMVIMARTVITARIVHTVPAALPAGSDRLGNSCSISRDALGVC